MKRCSVFFRREATFVISTSQMVSGVWSDIGPVFRMEPMPLPAKLGEAVLKALAESRVGLALKDPTLEEKEFARMVGSKSWNAFVKGAKEVMVSYDDIQIRIVPTRRDRTTAWGKSDKDAAYCDPEPEAVGHAVLDRLPHCSG